MHMSNEREMTIVESTAKLRRELRETFIGTVFTVRGQRGTARGFVRVSWTDGPKAEDVRRAVTDKYETEWFDGTDDSTNHKAPGVPGSAIRSVMVQRHISDDLRAMHADNLEANGYRGDLRGAAFAIANGCSYESAAEHYGLRKVASAE